MLDVSFACHMPDCLEMPYQPEILYLQDNKIIAAGKTVQNSRMAYRMGGNSCLAGDYAGFWLFERELQTGDRIIFQDMIHYTTVKTTMFNGVTHPSIGIIMKNGEFRLLKQFTSEDYKNRMC
jgi:carboxynorspermidine decarboxylase